MRTVVVTVTPSLVAYPPVPLTVIVHVPASAGVTLNFPPATAVAVATGLPEDALGVQAETLKLLLLPTCLTVTCCADAVPL